jgi:exodeoxyribonuclease-3
MKVITFNVNGIRACLQKGLIDFIKNEDADLVCLQETKAQPDQVDLEKELPEYKQFWNSAERKGYSGTLILSKKDPMNIVRAELDNEGRTVCLEFDEFYIVDNYVPNAQDGLARIDYRLEWEDKRKEFLKELDKKKAVIMCGDLNVAHNEIDLKNPDTNHNNAGFSDQERNAFTELLSEGFKDAYRELYPDKIEYSWWSYRMKARERNVGWRIDYFVVSDRLMDKVKDVVIRNDVFGSDHCPVILDITIDF